MARDLPDERPNGFPEESNCDQPEDYKRQSCRGFSVNTQLAHLKLQARDPIVHARAFDLYSLAVWRTAIFNSFTHHDSNL
jgi:hypothetical protein